ncbi:MAG: DUF421 domain-containing protein [Firmicutes bacterium]|nr:DUF421 domain-containing protein [Bacillota bacterium]
MLLVLIKAGIIYFVVFFCVRLTGKRQLGEMQPVELIVMLMLADLAAIPISDPSIPFYYGVIPIVALTFFSIIISLIARKSLIARRLISGKSVIVIDKGGINYKNLKKMNLNMHDLIEAIRSSGYPDINTIEYAIFATNGKLCVIEKESDPTKPTPAFLPLILIVDGKYNEHNLQITGLKQREVDVSLRKNGIIDIKEVLYMDVRQDGTAYISSKKDKYFNETLRVQKGW